MNILPKKRWHVRTKENIARVRKDEAEAEEKARQEKIRIETADREARLNVLKQKSKERLLDLDLDLQSKKQDTKVSQHINFFSDFEHAVQTTNKEHDKEIKDKKEEYEKKIGYLTYLGQDTNEALGKKNWYEVPPESSRFSRPTCIKDTYEKLVLKDPDGKTKEKSIDEKDGEIAWKAKQHLDPINAFKQYCSQLQTKCIASKQENDIHIKQDVKKHREKSKHHETKDKLQKLRQERLKREQQEKHKTEIFLAKLHGAQPETDNSETPKKIKPKYNSQFNPELARQNYR